MNMKTMIFRNIKENQGNHENQKNHGSDKGMEAFRYE